MIRGTVLEPLAWWAYSAIAVTGLCGIIYFSTQQSFRQNLNDPQIQIAEDAAQALEQGALPADIVPHNTRMINLRDSLTPWIGLYDSAHVPLESSGVLDNAPPVPPAGTFDPSTWVLWKTYLVNVGEETRFTWQAAPDVRQASVLIKLQKPSNGVAYVAVGRNMKEIEARIIDVGSKILFAWIFTLGCLLVASFIGWALLKPTR